MTAQTLQHKFDALIGKSKVSYVLPLLENVARENGLKLNRANDFKKARILLSRRYMIKRLA